MDTDPASRTARYLAAVDRAMLAELGQWDWGPMPALRRIVESQISRSGKRLRPLLTMAIADLHGGPWEDVVTPAASVELYHIASLVLDDVQDNSEVRRGKRAVHTTASTSTAINVAAVTRSLSYHPIHRDARLTSLQKLRLHRELDVAATHLVLGQSIDIGWSDGWYAAPGDFPYASMVRWKTGSLYGCAAAMAAVTCGAHDVDTARDLGVSFGSLFQGVDDYLDVFGDETALRRPRFEDFRGGKLSGPLISLLDSLAAAGRSGEVALINSRLADGDASTVPWLLDLMGRYAVGDAVRSDLSRQARHLRRRFADEFPDGRTASVERLIDVVMAQVDLGRRAAPTVRG